MSTTGPAPQRRMRADARRNYERLLAAAATVFAEHGVDASLEDIARRAGVANGTLYGHFPTRQALLEALLRDRMDALTATARDLLDHPSAHEALVIWARAAMAHTTTYRGLVTALMRSIKDESSELHAACRAVLVGGEQLLTRAQARRDRTRGRHGRGPVRHDQRGGVGGRADHARPGRAPADLQHRRAAPLPQPGALVLIDAPEEPTPLMYLCH
ncbi:TetR/AcrR family transcriptional regulator [Nonomuraea dietziae]|uniref:TetR/AcrR family transcriptional regulator n=1 Tax=Nonomuraea dietziae TaxID=65515 RepID=UPI003371463F